MKISWTFGGKAPRKDVMLETKTNQTSSQNEKTPAGLSTTRFFVYVALGVVAFALLAFLTGGILTQFIWPAGSGTIQTIPHPESH